MKGRQIVLIIALFLIPIPNYLLYQEYINLTSNEFHEFINNNGYGVFLMLSFVFTCAIVGTGIIVLTVDNWNKAITLKSIFNTIKSI